jgi:hypothetical protein
MERKEEVIKEAFNTIPKLYFAYIYVKSNMMYVKL